MVLSTDADIKKVVDICKKYNALDIDAICEHKRYVVDAKSLGGMRLLKDGGEVYFRTYGVDSASRDQFIKELVEVSNEIG